ncbi:hypothetical protein GCM10009811_08390 [Nostocoides veronense]|uniref:HTH cro/C1-type domain-containing protein n=1 Tax=Nostocoides veronense TaxID=330836 RepID=A0ABP4XPL7_9MICO
MREPDLSQLRAIFNDLRAKSGMSFDDLASASGLTRGTLLNISSGRYNGDLRTWLMLARAWGVSLDEVLAPVWGSERDSPVKRRSR